MQERRTDAVIPHSEQAPAAATEATRRPHGLRGLLSILGPGFITGASDDDPSGIGAYMLAGAQLGYAPLWLAWVSLPLMAGVQYICARVGMVSGRGIAGVVREHYPRWLLYPAVLAL